MTLTGWDAAFPNWDNAPEADVILGYIGGGDQDNTWTAADWVNAKKKLWCPCFVPGVGQTPQQAFDIAFPQLKSLGLPTGCLMELDREANRNDLDAAWCNQFRGLIESAGWQVLGYTSQSTAGVFNGWAYRWIAIPSASAPASPAPYSGIQWSLGNSFDLDVFLDDLPFAGSTTAAPVIPPAPTTEEDDDVASGPFLVRTDSAWKTIDKGTVWIVWPSGYRTAVWDPTTRDNLTKQFGAIVSVGGRTLFSIPEAK